MLRLAARDPSVCRHFISLLAATALPVRDRADILFQFLAAGLEQEGD